MKTSRLALLANPSGDVRPRASGSGYPVGDSLSRSCRTAWKFLVVALCYCLLAFAASVLAATVSWDRNPEPDIVRYQVHYGTTSGNYTQMVDAGNQTSVAVNGLEPGVIYYITVTSVNEAGLESAPSAEISYQEPAAPLGPATLVPQADWVPCYVDSEEGGDFSASKAFDGDPSTYWHTRWTGGTTPPPHEIQIDLGEVYPIEGFRYLPRQDNSAVGNIAQYEFYTSLDGSSWGAPAASGIFPNSSAERQVTFTNRNARFVRLRCLSEAGGGASCNVAELNLLQGEPITTPGNQAPVADGKSLSAAEDSTVPVVLTASDSEGDSLFFSVLSGPSHGVLSGSAPNLIYTPAANFSGADSFTYQAHDGTLDSNTATVSISVTPVNDAPVVQSKSVTTAEDTPVSVPLSAIDVEGDSLTYSVLSGPAKGSLSGTAPNLIYIPDANANGTDSFTYRATDGSANSNTATVTITLNAVNDAPLGASRSITATAGQPATVLLSATDPEGSALTYTVVSAPSHGSLSGTAPNLSYIAAANYSGSDSFTFRASDGSAASNTATISITVNPASGVDEVIPSSGWKLKFVDSEEAPAYQALRAFDGNPDTFWHTRFTSGATPPPHEIQIDLGGLHLVHGFRYLPRQDSSLIGNIGSFAFYTSMDGVSWGSPAATGIFANNHELKAIPFSARNARFIRLVGLSEANGSMHASVAELMLLGAELSNSTPSAEDLAFAAYKNSSCKVTLEGTDPDGDVLSYSIVQGPSHGTLRGNAASWTYQPVAGFTGEDSFVYAASDGSLSAEATVVVRVSSRTSGGDNSAPVFKADPIRPSYAIEKKSYGGESLAGIVEDADSGDLIRFSKTSGPAWLEVSPNGKLSGTPPAGSSGVHRFKVTATDKSGASSNAELIIEIHKDLPLPWDLETIGETVRGGDAGRSASGALVLTGGGALAGTSDAGTYAWQILSGDGEAVARVASLAGGGPNTRAGIMIRDSLSARSANVFLGVNGGGDLRWVCREHAGEPSKTRKAGKGSPRNSWIRLVRKGGEVTAFTSDDGRDWSRVGSVSADFGKYCYVGLMVSGGRKREATAAFRDVKIRP